MRKHFVAAAAAADLLLAVPVPPAAADGLSRFTEALRDTPPGLVTYEGGRALGDNGFVVENIVIKVPEGATAGAATGPVRMRKLTVEDFDFAAVEKQDAPNFAKLRAEGIAIPAAAFEGLDLREMTGRDTIIANLAIDYRFDPEQRTMALNRLELELDGLARIELSMVLDGVKLDDPESTGNTSLRTASLVYEDRSLLATALPNVAKAQGIDPAKIAEVAAATLDSLRPGQPAATLAVLDALAAFAADYRQPKGPLRVTVTPVRAMTLTELGQLGDAGDVAKVLVLDVSYAGARPANDAKPANPAQ
jgi:hypothetical protein